MTGIAAPVISYPLPTRNWTGLTTPEPRSPKCFRLTLLTQSIGYPWFLPSGARTTSNICQIACARLACRKT